MQSEKYLSDYGWKGHGNPLSENGLVHPILIKHKKDRKGIGLVNNLDQKDKWWETMFDNNLKNLNTELDNATGDIVMKKLQKDEEVFQDTKKSTSALYTSMFVKGKGLQGTIGETIAEDHKMSKIVSRSATEKEKSKKTGDKKEKKKLKLKIKIEKKEMKKKQMKKKGHSEKKELKKLKKEGKEELKKEAKDKKKQEKKLKKQSKKDKKEKKRPKTE